MDLSSLTPKAIWNNLFKSKESKQAESFASLFKEIKEARPSWNKDGSGSIDPARSSIGVPQAPPAERELPLPKSKDEPVPGLIVPRIYTAEDDGATYEESVIYVNAALATADVNMKNVTPL